MLNLRTKSHYYIFYLYTCLPTAHTHTFYLFKDRMMHIPGWHQIHYCCVWFLILLSPPQSSGIIGLYCQGGLLLSLGRILQRLRLVLNMCSDITNVSHHTALKRIHMHIFCIDFKWIMWSLFQILIFYLFYTCSFQWLVLIFLSGLKTK